MLCSLCEGGVVVGLLVERVGRGGKLREVGRWVADEEGGGLVTFVSV